MCIKLVIDTSLKIIVCHRTGQVSSKVTASSSDSQLSLMTVYGSDLRLTVGRKQNKDDEATRAIECEVLYDYA